MHHCGSVSACNRARTTIILKLKSLWFIANPSATNCNWNTGSFDMAYTNIIFFSSTVNYDYEPARFKVENKEGKELKLRLSLHFSVKSLVCMYSIIQSEKQRKEKN